MRHYLIICLCISLLSIPSYGQSDEDAFEIKEMMNMALTKGKGYDWLTYITTKIGGRLSGTPQAAAAVEYTRQMLNTMGLDTVWLQPCMVPHWVRGEKEVCRVVNSKSMGSFDLNVLALGNTEGTGVNGVTAEVIEVKSLEEVEKLGRANIEGKIVFYNRPMDATQINTFAAYSGAVDQRVYGAAIASNFGAVAAIVRSMTLKQDDVPHTGVSSYGRLEKGAKPIASVAVSTNDADKLSQLLKQDESVRVYLRTTSYMSTPKLSHNVIGEIRGSEFPDEIILVGGHLDSWDIGTGAHDDGAGCVQSMDVLYLMKQMNYKPKRTIRCVLFMNEENGQEGSVAYANESNKKGEFHLAAMESDRGGFTPRGFTADADAAVFVEKFKKLVKWSTLFRPYGMDFSKGGSGADVSRLKSQKGLLLGFLPDSQRYFDHHHAPNDTIDTVNKRELQFGAGAMLSLVYLLDQYGL